MKEEIIFAGFGGQGIMFAGKLFTYAGMLENKYVTWLPSYGAEVRGGTAFCMNIISDQEIASPLIRKPNACIVMSQPALLKYKDSLAKGGLLIINSSMAAADVKQKGIDIVNMPMTEIASKLGNQKAANMVGLGYYIKKRKPISMKTVLHTLEENLNVEMFEVNKKALLKGEELASS